jgi:hypothetical protein
VLPHERGLEFDSFRKTVAEGQSPDPKKYLNSEQTTDVFVSVKIRCSLDTSYDLPSYRNVIACLLSVVVCR